MNETQNELNAEAETSETENETSIESLQIQLSEATQNSAKLKDQMLRKAAEFENYKRRISADNAVFMQFAGEKLLKDILPIMDDLLRSLQATKETKSFETLYSGVELIANKFSKTLEKNGVKPFDSVGTAFDVNLHDVLMSIPRNDMEDHTILEEVEKGYMMHDKVLRHAKVVVAVQPVVEDVAGISSSPIEEKI
ncbi:MAG: nucleotide exchange factor GrpE [Bacteroidota bacterium]